MGVVFWCEVKLCPVQIWRTHNECFRHFLLWYAYVKQQLKKRFILLVHLFLEENVQEASTSYDGVPDEYGMIPAVMMSYIPPVRKRRSLDSFGYGLPEIVAPKDVSVPLVVGNQEVWL